MTSRRRAGTTVGARSRPRPGSAGTGFGVGSVQQVAEEGGVVGVVEDPAGVVEQLPHGDRGAVRDQTGQPPLDRVVQPQRALADQLQHHGGDQRLGDAADPEPAPSRATEPAGPAGPARPLRSTPVRGRRRPTPTHRVRRRPPTRPAAPAAAHRPGGSRPGDAAAAGATVSPNASSIAAVNAASRRQRNPIGDEPRPKPRHDAPHESPMARRAPRHSTDNYPRHRPAA